MGNFWKSRCLILLVLFSTLGCAAEPSGPRTVQETSAVRKSLSDRIQFLEQYVTFDRNYTQLEYDVTFHNNGGGWVPGPSDWDIKIKAVVPASELEDWVPSSPKKSKATSTAWLSDIPGEISTAAISDWYEEGQRTVGIDWTNSVVVYRSTSTPH